MAAPANRPVQSVASSSSSIGPCVLSGFVRLVPQLLDCQPQAGDRRLEQPPIHVEEYALIQGVGQQAERRVDLVAGGLQVKPPLEPGAALAVLPALHLNRRLLVPAIGTAAPLGFRSAILALGGHGLRICSGPRRRANIARHPTSLPPAPLLRNPPHLVQFGTLRETVCSSRRTPIFQPPVTTGTGMVGREQHHRVDRPGPSAPPRGRPRPAGGERPEGASPA